METIRPTTHAEPTYVVDGVVHYGVANMPGAVPRTSTFALTNQTLPYVLKLAEKGLDAFWRTRPFSRGSTPTKAASPTPGWPRPSACPTRLPRRP